MDTRSFIGEMWLEELTNKELVRECLLANGCMDMVALLLSLGEVKCNQML